MEQSQLILNEPVEVELPFPPACVFPNAKRRTHWSRYSRATRNYRNTCFVLTRKAKVQGKLLKVCFHQPDKRRRDDDGMIAAFKAGRDGVAEALRVDDFHFRPQYAFADEPVKWGKVVVTIGDAL